MRSGKYRQTRKGALFNEAGNSYCCLGCLVHTCNLYNSSDEVLDLDTKELVGLSDKAEYKLIDLNDKAHYNFNKIADWIEENL